MKLDKPTATLVGHRGAVLDVAISLDGNKVASAGGEGVVKLWDVRTGLEVLRRHAHTAAVTGLSFSPDGKSLFTAAADGAVTAWDGAPQEAGPKAADLEKLLRQ